MQRLIVVGAIPPPHHGVTISTTLVLANETLRSRFEVEHLDTSDRRDLDNIGRWEPRNVVLGLRHVAALRRMTRTGNGVVYLPLSQSWSGFVRDSLFILTGERRGWRVAVHLRGGEFHTFLASLPRPFRWWIRFTMRRVAAVGVMSPSLRHMFGGLVPESAISVVPNGTPDPGPPDGRRDPQLGVFLSNLRRRKGVLEAVEAAVEVVQRHPTARFVFAGEWEDAALERLVAERIRSAGGRIEVVPPVTGADKHALLGSAGFLLFPPIEPEGHPRVVLEALAAGLPAITTRQGGIPDTVVHGESGFVLKAAAPEQLAERMLSLLRDPEAWARMSEAARARYLAEYTQDIADAKIADWLSQVAASA